MTETIIAIAFGLLSAVGLAAAVRSFLRREKAVVPPPTETSFVPPDIEERCFCGEVATEPMPYIEREREDDSAAANLLMRHHDRNVYAAPPRLRRTVDKNKPNVLCRVHAHVADAKIDEFLYGEVRAVLAAANAQIAIKAAGFERESLFEALKGSLTKTEKATKPRSVNGAANGASNGASSLSPSSLS